MNYISKNNYSGTVGVKALARDVFYALRFSWLYIRGGGKVKTVLCYPEFPHWHSNFHHLMQYSNIHITTNPNGHFDYVISWKDATHRKVDNTLLTLSKKYKVINLNCIDISKQTVEVCFKKVFGYGSFVDPLTYNGKLVEKSDLNGRHCHTKVLEGPVDRVKAGFVYQKLIETDADGSCRDVRVTIANNQLPVVYKRTKDPANRFHGVLGYKQYMAADLFSPDEIDKILHFCRLMNLEFGEIDTVRDVSDGRLYIIDVNNTPHQPPKGIRNKHYVNFELKSLKLLFLETARAGVETPLPSLVQ